MDGRTDIVTQPARHPGVDLLSRLVCLDPARRLTASEALAHRYFAEVPPTAPIGSATPPSYVCMIVFLPRMVAFWSEPHTADHTNGFVACGHGSVWVVEYAAPWPPPPQEVALMPTFKPTNEQTRRKRKRGADLAAVGLMVVVVESVRLSFLSRGSGGGSVPE